MAILSKLTDTLAIKTIEAYQQHLSPIKDLNAPWVSFMVAQPVQVQSKNCPETGTDFRPACDLTDNFPVAIRLQNPLLYPDTAHECFLLLCPADSIVNHQT